MAIFTLEDVSASTDPRLTFPLQVPRKGAMLHTTDGTDSLEYLQGGVLREGRIACADFLIRRDGHSYRLTPRSRAAYHAGRCRWQGVVRTDDLVSAWLYGLEFENLDRNNQVPTEEQYRAGALILLDLAWEHKWSPLHVWGHGSLAHPRGRRTDPAEFDWGFLFWLMGPGALKDELRKEGGKR